MVKEEMTVAEITTRALETYVRLGYSPKVAVRIKQFYAKFTAYCSEHNEHIFSMELLDKFRDSIYGKEPNSVKPHGDTIRAINVLHDYWLFGTVLRKTAQEHVLNPRFAETAEMYLDELRQRHLSGLSISRHRSSLIRFTNYLHSQHLNSPDEITTEHVDGFIKTIISQFSNKTIYYEIGVIRKYLRLIWENGKHPLDLSRQVNQMPRKGFDNHIPSAYTKEEIDKMLAVVERDSPVGKRNYAILLLATRLGLRTSDIRNMTFNNINWESNTIHLVQVKTKAPLLLPLTQDVGWALIDYIQNGRPVTDAKEIFVKMHPPYAALADYNSIILKYLRRAQIPLESHRHHGMHSLRHSLATRLLEEEIPLPVIQEVLGHLDCESTTDYMSIDIPHLRLCALEVPN